MYTLEMKKKTKRFLVEQLMKQWAKNNKEFVEDLSKLHNEARMFTIKWGTEVNFCIKDK